MNAFTFIKKSLYYYRRTHVGVLLGAALSTAILIGALVIGDSVRYSLERLVLDRLGRTTWAMQTGDRFFETSLADRLEKKIGYDAAALLRAGGISVAGDYRANKVQIVGVDKRFDVIGDCDLYGALKPDEVVINVRLAKKLHVTAGDDILLRIEKLDAMPKDAPLADVDEASVAQRFRVTKIADTKDFGRYSLRAEQVEPLTAFISQRRLQNLLHLKDKANVLLVAAPPNDESAEEQLRESLAALVTPADMGFSVRSPAKGRGAELRSDRIFIDAPIGRRLTVALPEAVPLLTYLVNAITCNDKETPYSFVSNAEAVGLNGLDENDIVINSWLAKDLSAQPGDELRLAFYRLGPLRSLVQDTASFRIAKIVPLAGRFADRSLMPDFPGLVEEENCRDWDAGVPIDFAKIRDKDEQYWDDYRGTPKAFISLKRAKELWGNRFGDLTGLRFQGVTPAVVEQKMAALIDPLDFGFVFQPVQRQGLDAAGHAVDFAGLFIGLSFFLIVAALLLTGMLFVFNVEQRSRETGLLLAIGLPVRRVHRLLLAEGAIIAFIGALLGIAFGIVFHQLILLALKTIWRDIVGVSALRLTLKPTTIVTGVVSGFAASCASLWLAARRQAGSNIADLQKGLYQIDAPARGRGTIAWIIMVIAAIVVSGVLLMTPPGRGHQASNVFFLAGTLLLFGGSALSWLIFLHLGRRGGQQPGLALASIGRRNNGRRRVRSLTLVGILAAGVFLTFTVGANRSSTLVNASQRSAGTGGFAMWGESTLPVVYDLNSSTGREQYGLENVDAKFVQIKVREGDEASCLNLHRIANPRLLGLDPTALENRGAFSVVKTTDDVDADHFWLGLRQNYGENVIPGIADQTVIQWSLGKQVGDTLAYVDEQGHEFQIRLIAGLANSVFQGNVLIDRDVFIKRFPSVGGSRAFLVDAPFDKIEEVSKKLSWGLQDVGLDLTPTSQRLAEFAKVSNTYLSIFMILGALGLILGSIGIGVVLMRNVLERRNELAIMRAMGFDAKSLRTMIYAEHIMLLFLGILVGAVASLVAVLPALMTPGASIPYAMIIGTMMIILISGTIWTRAATAMALRGELMGALRSE